MALKIDMAIITYTVLFSVFSSTVSISQESPPPAISENKSPNSESLPNPITSNLLAINKVVTESEKYAAAENLSSAEAIKTSFISGGKIFRGEAIDGYKALAIIALSEDPEFADEIKTIASFMGNAAFINALRTNPDQIQKLETYPDAAKHAGKYLGDINSRLDVARDIILKASYDNQKNSWAMRESQPNPIIEELGKAWAEPAAKGEIGISSFKAGQFNEIVAGPKIGAAAAAYILKFPDQAAAIAGIGASGQCAYSAYLTNRMCMSAAKFPYEHTFCIAKHEIEDFKACAINGITK